MKLPPASAPPRWLPVLLGGLVVSAGAWALLTMYGSRPSHADFVPPARAFLAAALSGDSSQLAQLALAPAAVRWARDAGKHNPALLRALLDHFHADGAMRSGGGRLAASFGAQGFRRCSRAPLTLIFAGDSASARIEDVVADCPLDAVPSGSGRQP